MNRSAAIEPENPAGTAAFAAEHESLTTSVSIRFYRPPAEIVVIAILIACLTLTGCGTAPSVKVVRGTVTCGGEAVPTGRVSFVPLDGTSGSTRIAPIKDGQYCIDAGGVLLGKYRVHIDAQQKTGRKVKGYNGVELAMIDEVVRVGPVAYAGGRSPLVVEVTGACDGTFDFPLPLQ
jgi:hypothetical protein